MVGTLDKSSTDVASKKYVDSLVDSNVTLKGGYNPVTNSPINLDPGVVDTIFAGDHFIITNDGTFLLTEVKENDTIIATINDPAVITDWIHTKTSTGISDPILLTDGLVGSPSYSFINQTNSGMYWTDGSNKLSLACNGSEVFKTTLSVMDFDVTSAIDLIIAGNVRLRATATGIGIGGDTPSHRLDVRCNVPADFITHLENENSSVGSVLRLKLGANTPGSTSDWIKFESANDEKASISGSGTGVEFSSPGTIVIDSGTGSTIIDPSDIRLKENITDFKFGLNEVLQMRPVEFNYIKDDDKKIKHGFIAQEMNEVYSHPVKVGGEDPETDAWKLDYTKFVPILVKSIQELNKELQDVKKELDELKVLI